MESWQIQTLLIAAGDTAAETYHLAEKLLYKPIVSVQLWSRREATKEWAVGILRSHFAFAAIQAEKQVINHP